MIVVAGVGFNLFRSILHRLQVFIFAQSVFAGTVKEGASRSIHIEGGHRPPSLYPRVTVVPGVRLPKLGILRWTIMVETRELPLL